MQVASTVAQQVIVMFLLIAVGVVSRKTNVVTYEGSRTFSNLLVTVIMPVMLINACIRPYQREDMLGLGLAFVLAIVSHIIAILTAMLFIRPKNNPDYRVDRMGAVYSNCGFMAFPILSVTLGDIGVFYGVAYVGVFSVFSWTHGRANLTGERLNVKNALLNPGTVAFYIGLLLYFTQLPLPSAVTETLSLVSDLNTPLAMIITGIFLADVDIKRMLTNFAIYRASLVRIVLAPGVTLLLMVLIGVSGWIPGAGDAAFANIIAAACPSAAFSTLLVAKLGLNSERSSEIIAVSTIFSLVTVPLFAFLASML